VRHVFHSELVNLPGIEAEAWKVKNKVAVEKRYRGVGALVRDERVLRAYEEVCYEKSCKKKKKQPVIFRKREFWQIKMH